MGNFSSEIRLTKKEEQETNREYDDLIKIATLFREIIQLAENAKNNPKNPRGRLSKIVSISNKANKLLANAWENYIKLEKDALALEKRLIRIGVGDKITKEEKYAIYLVKSIRFGLVYQTGYNQRILKLASQKYSEYSIIGATIEIISMATLIESHILAIAPHVKTLRRLEILIEKQERQFAKRGKV